ncbi:hypothetical protein AM593_02837, partial [Mytilus galloprovincialis]
LTTISSHVGHLHTVTQNIAGSLVSQSKTFVAEKESFVQRIQNIEEHEKYLELQDTNLKQEMVIKHLRSEIVDLKVELNHQINQLEIKLKDANVKRELKQQETENLLSKITGIKTQMQSLTKDLDLEREEKIKLKTESTKLRKQNSDLQEKIRQQTSKVVSLENDMLQVKSEKESSKSEFKILEKKMSETEKMLKDKKQKNDELSRDIIDAKSKAEEFEQENKRLENKNNEYILLLLTRSSESEYIAALQGQLLKQTMRRKQYLKIICVCCCVLFLYNLYYANVSPYPQTHYQEENPSTQLTSRPVFLVDTPTCKIPLFSPFDVSIVQFLKPGKKISCNKFLPYTYEDGIILRVNWTAIDQSRHKETFKYCRYQPIIRPYEAEHHNYYDYGDYSEKFDSYIEVSYEFIRVRCYNRASGKIYTNYHQFIYPKKTIEKLKSTAFEKHKAKVSETLNVMMVGVDSISRLNFKRYTRKTNAFLTNRLQAFDMMGYNKVADNTFVNIVPMTLGKFLEDVPWNESLSDIPFDNYNFIWKMFSDRGYRTLYAEDAPKIAIFDYLKAGFHKAPADYFNRHFSIAMTKDKPLWYNEHNCLVNR